MSFLKRVVCPHCWHQFAPEKILWVSEHNDLLGDPRLGNESQQRFLPTRFTVNGEAIDAKGFPCHQLACPQCHLGIPRAMLEMEPYFFSIFGAPASGKSYYLAAMSWELRRVLPLDFRLSFSDADPVLNQNLNDYEESLFSNASPDSLVPLAGLIRKTEEQGELYDVVSFGTQTVSYPRPFLFAMQPQLGHPNLKKAEQLGRAICLYDNAGESFQPGKDTANNPVTRHMAQSRALFFVFDPTQDARFQKHCYRPEGSTASSAGRTMRQEPILQEAAARIRRYSGLRQSEKHSRPLIIILTKCDRWLHLLEETAYPEPWRLVKKFASNGSHEEVEIHALDEENIVARSQRTRALLLHLCPEIVTASESFAESVYYIPVSAVGWQTEVEPSSGLLAIRPGQAEPYWVTVPFVFGLSKTTSGLIPTMSRPKSDGRNASRST